MTDLEVACALATGGQAAAPRLALAADPGGAWAWGGNYDGELGDGICEDHDIPAPVADLSGFTAIAASVHSLGLKTDGTVWAWGDNSSGELGIGTIDIARHCRPVQVKLGSGAPLTGVTAVVAGLAHSLALDRDGNVWAWGLDVDGQLGFPVFGGFGIRPLQVPGLNGITAIAAGARHSLARKSDGTVWTWGDNEWGQLGTGSADTNPHYDPAKVASLDDITGIAAGGDHTLAIRTPTNLHFHPSLWTWGDNHFGQLGIGTHDANPHSIPQSVMTLDRGDTSIAGGSIHSLLRKPDGTLLAWGDNGPGQLGDGSSADRRDSPVPVTGLDSVTAIAAGSGHSLALRSDGGVWAWGSNGYGGLGIGSFDLGRHPSPVRVPRLNGAVAIAAGSFDSLALAGPQSGSASLTSSASLTQVGQPVTLTATASAQLGTPAGAVTFKEGSMALGSAPLDGTGKATLTLSNLSHGSHSITAAYGGSVHHASSTSAPVTLIVSPPRTGNYHPLTPYRVFDSRPEYGGAGPLDPGQSVDVRVSGLGGVPAGTGSVALNVTAVSPSGASFPAVYPAGGSLPTVSNLNFGQGTTIANLVQVGLGSAGKVTLYNSVNTVQVAVDVQGWYSAAPEAGSSGLFVPLPAPQRLMDTRPQTQVGPYGTPFVPDSTRGLRVTGEAPLPAAGKVSAVVLNVTGVSPSEGTYLTAFPTGADRPNASNVNIPPGRNLPNRVIATVGAGGLVSIYNSAGLIDVVIDMVGWFTNGTDPAQTGGYFHAITPARILDTRPGAGNTGPYSTAFGPQTTRPAPAAGQGGLPASGVQAISGNLTGVAASTGTYLVAWPTDAPGRPTASDLNLGVDDTIPNLALVRLGADGQVYVYNDQGSLDVLLDISGYYGQP